MTIRLAINGFGRLGLRAVWDQPELEVVHVNEIGGDAATAAHLLEFDSIHGAWDKAIEADAEGFSIDGRHVAYSTNAALEDTDWGGIGVDVVVECTGQFKSRESLAPYLEAGVRKVVVSAPMKDGTPNVVMGVNESRYDSGRDAIVTAASCTTNCIAPVIGVVNDTFGIRHGTVTTIHDITNTQSVLDQFHKDLRRTRASGLSLIPTSTGSATAIAEIFPELKGRLSGIAVRVPLANASLSDLVLELEREATADAVNEALEAAAAGPLAGILGVEHRPLVSADFRGDRRSAIVDAPATMVVDGTQLKILAWYDNEIGYVHRMMELVALVARGL